jgi:hypothetical protein
VTTTELPVKFLGLAAGAEILGAIQADFAIDPPHGHARELSVLLNEPAAAFLAQHLGVEDTPEWRQRAAQEVGAAWLRYAFERGRKLDSITFLSKALLEANPDFLASLKA